MAAEAAAMRYGRFRLVKVPSLWVTVCPAYRTAPGKSTTCKHLLRSGASGFTEPAGDPLATDIEVGALHQLPDCCDVPRESRGAGYLRRAFPQPAASLTP